MSGADDYIYLMRMQEELRRAKRDGKPGPQFIFEQIHRDPLIRAWFETFRRGDVSWEQMLTGIVRDQCEQIEKLRAALAATHVPNWAALVTAPQPKAGGH